jgi:hypothetical protein
VAQAAIDRLDAVGANLVGVLLNGADIDHDRESYLPFYHRDYQYYSPEVTSWPTDLPAFGEEGDPPGKVAPQVQAKSS